MRFDRAGTLLAAVGPGRVAGRSRRGAPIWRGKPTMACPRASRAPRGALECASHGPIALTPSPPTPLGSPAPESQRDPERERGGNSSGGSTAPNGSDFAGVAAATSRRCLEVPDGSGDRRRAGTLLGSRPLPESGRHKAHAASAVRRDSTRRVRGSAAPGSAIPRPEPGLDGSADAARVQPAAARRSRQRGVGFSFAVCRRPRIGAGASRRNAAPPLEAWRPAVEA